MTHASNGHPPRGGDRRAADEAAPTVNKPVPAAPGFPAGHEDQELLRRIAKQDRAAFSEFYDRYAARAFGLVIRIIHDRAVAEDVLQELFLQVWSRAASYNPALSSPLAWVLLLARGRSIDALRRMASEARHAARNQTLVAATRPDAAPSTGSADRETEGEISLDRLPADQAEVIRLAYHGGMTCVQIAELLGLPLGTVKTRIRLGIKRLREIVECPSLEYGKVVAFESAGCRSAGSRSPEFRNEVHA